MTHWVTTGTGQAWAAAVAVAVAVGACTAEPAPPSPAAPPTLSGLQPAANLSKLPGVFELVLKAKPYDVHYLPQIHTPAWTYNEQVPGPLIVASVGDKLVAHFHNLLPQSTTVHWHGIRLPNAMDGALAVQNPVLPGGTFEYAFALQDPGLYWFHPHHRTDEQIAKGLYGVIVVRGPHEPPVDRELVLVLDDAELDAKGRLPGHLDDYHQMTETQKYHGRSGSSIVVNGKVGEVLRLQAGALTQLRLLNTANLRHFNLRMPGHQLRVIGSDGGLFAQPYDVDTLVVGPAERYDVLVVPQGKVGAHLTLVSDVFPRAEDDPQPAFDIADIELTGPALEGRKLLTNWGQATPPRIAVPPGEPLQFELDFGRTGGLNSGKLPPSPHDPIPQFDGDPIFYINGKAGSDIAPIKVQLGQTLKMRFKNVSHQIHSLHLHGFFFQIVDTEDEYDAKTNPFGLRPQFMAQAHKDTIVLREGYATTLVATFDAPGRWMYHCHIPEHAERGMMAEIHVGLP